MNHCTRPVTAYRVTNADGQSTTVHECDTCHCRHSPIVDYSTGAVTWRWMPKAGYCTRCRLPIWRFATDPQSGQPVLLWPGPDVRSAQYAHENGGLSQPIDYCRRCLPKIGQAPKHRLTAGGTSIGFGACVAHVSVAERYAEWFTEARRAFYEAWGRDHLMLDDTHHQIFMAQWAADRAAIVAADRKRGVATVSETDDA